MIIALVGESASGKTTLANALIEADESFSRIVTYTTRPMRQGEIQDVDYHFITNDDFDNKVKKDFFFESATYRDWHYGSAIDFDINENKVIVLTPAGVRALRRKAEFDTELKNELVVVYLCVDRRSRLIKIVERGDNIDEAYRRNLSDCGQFDSFAREADYVINNDSYSKTKEQILSELLTIIDYRRQNG